MQNPIDSPRFSTAVEPNLDVYANNSFQAPDQENIENPVTSEAQSPEYSPKATKFEPSITPDNRSNQSSPVNFNFLAEVGRAKRRSPTQSEDSNSLFVAKFENEHVDTSNINSKIAQILVESKSVSPDARHERFDLSFEMKTDCSIDVNDISDNMKQSHIKKQKKGKEPQNVAFDDSLNNDLFHDPNISSIAHVKTMDLSKRTDFIGLSQMHLGNEREHENKTPNNMKEMKKVITTLEYKPERGRYEQMVQGHQALSLFEGVSEPNESRLSKMSEEEAAFLFESRKNTLMKGLQKLNKHRKVNITPKSNSQSPKARGSRNTTEKSPYSAGGDSSPGRQSVKGFVVENVEARRSKSSQHSKQHVNHQKAYKSVRVDTYEQLGITDSPINGPVAVKKGRSLSHQDVKPLEIESLDLLDSSRITPGKNKIDEMYQMAKEDVKKRIASIDKRLVETEGLQSGRRSADSKPTRKTHSPRTQQITLTVVPNKERSVDKTDRSSKQKPKFATEPSPVNKNDKFKTERGRAFQEDAYQLVGKKVLTINLTTADYEAMRKHGNNSKSPKTFEQQIKKKTEERINIIRKELSPSSQERPPSGRNAYDIKPTMQTQSYDGIKADTKKYSIEDNRYKQYDAKTVQRTPIGPPKFTDLEAMASQGNSYSQMHHEKRNKLLVNNRASEGVMKSGPIRAKESFGGPVKVNMVYNLADAGTPRSKNKKNLHVRFSDQDKKEAQDVKYFVLRPEAEKVVNTKRTNTSTSAVKPNDRISLEINKRPSQESVPTKQAKIMRPLVSESNNVQNQQQSKIPRSSSFKQIKPYKNMEMLPTNPVDQRLKTCEPVYTVSEGKVKQTEPQVSSPRSTGSSWNAKPEKKRVPSVSKTQPKTWNKAITDRPSSPKTPYTNKDSMTPQKKEPLVRNSVPVTQKKEKLIYATSVENMEELLSRNYRFLEIRNNQYVFTAN